MRVMEKRLQLEECNDSIPAQKLHHLLDFVF